MTVHREHRRVDPPLTAEAIASCIRIVRGQRVLLDEDLARLYGVPTGAINQAVARNRDRFPDDFLFRVTRQQLANLKSQFVISRWGGRRSAILAFTEQGVAMLSSVLRSPQAIEANIAIMRAFVRLRGLLVEHGDLARKLGELERKLEEHDASIAAVFEAIRQLLHQEPPDPPQDRIGFGQGS